MLPRDIQGCIIAVYFYYSILFFGVEWWPQCYYVADFYMNHKICLIFTRKEAVLSFIPVILCGNVFYCRLGSHHVN